jgi:guanylate kinase
MSAGAMSQRGDLVVIAAPSGAGKTTLVHALLKRMPDLQFSISYTTRAPRPAEKDGVDYFFVSALEFERMRAADEFLEHALVFDHWYGTGKADVAARRAAGHTVVLEIDWLGARQVRRAAPEARSIFIAPPSVAELEERLRGRGTDSDAVIRRRLADSVSDLGHWDEFDYLIVNDDVATAATELADVVSGGGDEHRSASAAVRARVEEILAGSR